MRSCDKGGVPFLAICPDGQVLGHVVARDHPIAIALRALQAGLAETDAFLDLLHLAGGQGDPVNISDPNGSAISQTQQLDADRQTVNNLRGTEFDSVSRAIVGAYTEAYEAAAWEEYQIAQSRPPVRRGHNGGPPIDPLVARRSINLQGQINSYREILGLGPQYWVGNPTAASNQRLELELMGLKGHANPVAILLPSQAGVVREFVTTRDQVYYRVFSGANNVGGWVTSVRPNSQAFAREALSLPRGNTAQFVQEVFVPAGTRMIRSRAAPMNANEIFPDRRGGAEQFNLVDPLPKANFGPGIPLK